MWRINFSGLAQSSTAMVRHSGVAQSRSRLMWRLCLCICIAFSQTYFAHSEEDKVKLVYAEQLLASLRSDTQVMPRLPDVHPVRTVANPEAIVPPQCYTKTEGRFNPCYVCHQDALPKRENVMNDGALQIAYSFSDVGMTNHWQNLFEDRTAAVAAISDKEIADWIAQDNYSELAPRLREAGFQGWVPDLKNLQLGAAAFDADGFAKDGSQWVAFNYKPMPSTFWPTNGATDDVMIRLPIEFRTNTKGEYSRAIYLANLSIVEAKIKGFAEITTPPIDEREVGQDLNGDGKLGQVEKINQVKQFVGAAAAEFIDDFLYPKGTEFLHTVRYVGVDKNNQIVPSARIKEVRYMYKAVAYRKSVYARGYQLEGYAKELGQLPQYHYLGDLGLDNGFGWQVQGFIENAQGRLRTLTYEENLFCMGCHASVGSTIDKSFSFPRKVDGAKGWGYINLKGMPDAPNMGESEGEIITYLKRVGGGGEFRSNAEMQQQWFMPSGEVNTAKVLQAEDVYQLITPSPARAMELNKAYKVIVDNQDYAHGRDAMVLPPANVYREIDNDTAPTLPEELLIRWDIRLAW